MKWRRKGFLILCVGLFLLFLYALTYDIDGQAIKPVYRQISVISRENKNDNFETIRQGMEQAAIDMNVEISFILLSEKNDVKEQIRLLDREINNGAEAIILSAADSVELAQVIEEISVPIIAMESPINSSEVSGTVVGQDFQMGKVLGEKIIYKGIYGKKILILESSKMCANIQERKKGFISSVEGGTTSIESVEISDGPEQGEEIFKLLQEKDVDIVISLESSVLESAAQAVSLTKNTNLRLHGIGVTSKTAPYIEKKIVDTVVVQNNFNLGYLSVISTMESLQKKGASEVIPIDFTTVNSYTMYSNENQRLLFPFIK